VRRGIKKLDESRRIKGEERDKEEGGGVKLN